MFIQFVIGVVCGAVALFQLAVVPPSAVTISIILISFLLVLMLGFLLSVTTKVIDANGSVDYSKQLSKKNHPNLRLKIAFLLSSYGLSDLLKSHALRAMNLLTGFALGMSLVILQIYLAPSLPSSLHDKKSVYLGKVSSLPVIEQTANFTKVRFNFTLSNVLHTDSDIYYFEDFTQPSFTLKQPEIQVTWYLKKSVVDAIQLPRLGEQWLLFGKLKSNHASHNFFAADYEAWLFQKGLLAKLSVSGQKPLTNHYQSALNALLNTPNRVYNHAVNLEKSAMLNSHWYSQIMTSLSDSVYASRNFVATELAALTQQSPNAAVYHALLLGDKSAITPQQWKLFQETGTIHLMAISGLHMSIMALLGFYIAKLSWWLLGYRQRWVTFPIYASLISLIFTTYYLLISGGAVPTQRAWIMVTTIIVFLSMRRSFQPFTALAMAALLVLLWDVKALLSSGFWLSFIAVWLIFSSLQLIRPLHQFNKVLVIQFVLSLGLLPVIAWLYFEIPLYGFVANLLAVPFVTFLGLPWLLSAQLLALFNLEFAIAWLDWLDALWLALFSFLTGIQRWPNAVLSVGYFSILPLITFYLGWILIMRLSQKWLFANADFYQALWKWLAIMLVYSVLSLLVLSGLNTHQVTKGAQVEMIVFDVGQGQALLFKTENHSVLYDSGAKWGKTDAATIAILPYFKAHNLKDAALFIVSHSDIDHAGGAATILRALQVKNAYSGQAEKLNDMLLQQANKNSVQQDKVLSNINDKIDSKTVFSACKAGQQWHLDGVTFSILSPQGSSTKLSDNDASCVLRVSVADQAVLVMGDLSIKAEDKILNSNKLNAKEWQAQLLIAGHHGSRHSTSSRWLKMVKPEMVVYSAGYQNRFAFPQAEVIQRTLQVNSNIKWWNTACSGALRFELTQTGIKLLNEARKTQSKWYHHRCLQTQQGILYQ